MRWPLLGYSKRDHHLENSPYDGGSEKQRDERKTPSRQEDTTENLEQGRSEGKTSKTNMINNTQFRLNSSENDNLIEICLLHSEKPLQTCLTASLDKADMP